MSLDDIRIKIVTTMNAVKAKCIRDMNVVKFGLWWSTRSGRFEVINSQVCCRQSSSVIKISMSTSLGHSTSRSRICSSGGTSAFSLRDLGQRLSGAQECHGA